MCYGCSEVPVGDNTHQGSLLRHQLRRILSSGRRFLHYENQLRAQPPTVIGLELAAVVADDVERQRRAQALQVALGLSPPGSYCGIHRRAERPFANRKGLSAVAKLGRSFIQSVTQVGCTRNLEVGFGAGEYLLGAAQANPETSTFGVDMSSVARARVRSRAAGLGLANLRCVERLEQLDGERFDAAYLESLAHLLDAEQLCAYLGWIDAHLSGPVAPLVLAVKAPGVGFLPSDASDFVIHGQHGLRVASDLIRRFDRPESAYREAITQAGWRCVRTERRWQPYDTTAPVPFTVFLARRP